MRVAGFDTYDFDHLVDVGGSFRRWTTGSWSSPSIDLSDGLDGYMSQIERGGSNVVAQLAYQRRRLEREHGRVSFDPDCRDSAVLDELLAQKRAQYVKTGRNDPLAHEWRRELLQQLFGSESENCHGALSVLRVGGTEIALHFGLRSRHVLHYWLPVYRPEFARYSPGLLLLVELIRDAAERGMTRIDLGTGEAEYKRRLANSEIVLSQGSVELWSPVVVARRARWWVRAHARRAGRLPEGGRRALSRT
jgi:CelD/BcsL family acetyltransferase involved in cellulose biosynthesis